MGEPEYKKNCGGCGQFVLEELWVKRSDPIARISPIYPLCVECLSSHADCPER